MDPIAGFNLGLSGYPNSRINYPRQTSFGNEGVNNPFTPHPVKGVEPPQPQAVTPLDVLNKLNEEITISGKQFGSNVNSGINTDTFQRNQDPSVINTLVNAGKDFFNSLFSGQNLILAGMGEKEAGVFRSSGQDYASIAQRIDTNLDQATRELERLKTEMKVHAGNRFNQAG